MTEFGKRPGALETLRRSGAKNGNGNGQDPAVDERPDAVLPDGQDAPETGAVTGPEREFTVEVKTQWQIASRRFLRHKLAMISLVMFILVAMFGFFGESLYPYSSTKLYYESGTVVPKVDAQGNLLAAKPIGGPTLSKPSPRCDGGDTAKIPTRFLKDPCFPHLLGSDQVGHDMVAQIMRGTKKSLLIAIVVALVSTVLGVTIGAIAGFYGGFVDTMLMRFVDLMLTIPLIAIAGTLSHHVQGGQWWLLAFILAGLSWMPIARVIRGQFLSLREKEFVEAAKALGASDRRIIFRHILPNTVGTIIVNATLVVATAILAETALSFLGLGVKSPDTSLGKIISENQAAFNTRWWLFWFPGLFIIMISLTVNFIGDGLRDALDPKQTRVRA